MSHDIAKEESRPTNISWAERCAILSTMHRAIQQAER
jgi:hypothetical protein